MRTRCTACARSASEHPVWVPNGSGSKETRKKTSLPWKMEVMKLMKHRKTEVTEVWKCSTGAIPTYTNYLKKLDLLDLLWLKKQRTKLLISHFATFHPGRSRPVKKVLWPISILATQGIWDHIEAFHKWETPKSYQIIHSTSFHWFFHHKPPMYHCTLSKIYGNLCMNTFQSSESLGCSANTKRGGSASLRHPEETCHPACGATAKSRPIEERNFNARKLT